MQKFGLVAGPRRAPHVPRVLVGPRGGHEPVAAGRPAGRRRAPRPRRRAARAARRHRDGRRAALLRAPRADAHDARGPRRVRRRRVEAAQIRVARGGRADVAAPLPRLGGRRRELELGDLEVAPGLALPLLAPLSLLPLPLVDAEPRRRVVVAEERRVPREALREADGLLFVAHERVVGPVERVIRRRRRRGTHARFRCDGAELLSGGDRAQLPFRFIVGRRRIRQLAADDERHRRARRGGAAVWRDSVAWQCGSPSTDCLRLSINFRRSMNFHKSILNRSSGSPCRM